MALNFPLNPTAGQQYTYPPFVYEWDGDKWVTITSPTSAADELREDLAADTGASIVGTSTGQTVQYELDNHTHTAAEVGALPSGGTAVAAAKLSAARSIALTGDATGSVLFDGSANVSITTVVVDDLHNHTIANVDNLQAALDAKLDTTGNATTASSAAKLTTARTIALTGDATSTAISFDGSANISIPVTVVDDLHNHTIANVDGLQAALDGKLDDAATAAAATKLATARTISLTGDVTGSVTFDGTANASITAVVVDDSHNHTIANVDNLQSTLDGKSPTSHSHTAADVGAVPTTEGTAEYSRQVAPKNAAWGDQTDRFRTGSSSAPAGSGRSDFCNWIQWGHNGGQKLRHTLWCPADNSKPAELWFAHQNNTTDTNGPVSHWRVYHQGFKPTAAEVGALPAPDPGGVIEIGKYIDFHDTGTNVDYSARIYCNGAEVVFSGNGSFNDIYVRSDLRLKSNLNQLNSALDKVNKLTGYTYDKKPNLTSKDTNREVGLIAQQLQEVLPEAVSSASEEGLLSISNSGVNALLVEAIKELTAKMWQQQEEMNTLKHHIGKN